MALHRIADDPRVEPERDLLDGDDLPTYGLLYAVGTATAGENTSVTGGAAIGFAEGEFARHPALMLGLEQQVSNSIKFISENYLIPQSGAGLIVSGGIRFFGDRLAADLALVTASEILSEGGGFPFVPWLGFAYNYGR